jgi:hypothetical protein
MADQKIFDGESFSDDDIVSALDKSLKTLTELTKKINETKLTKFTRDDIETKIMEYIKYAKYVEEEKLAKTHKLTNYVIDLWHEKDVIMLFFENVANCIKDGKINSSHKDDCIAIEQIIRKYSESSRINKVKFELTKGEREHDFVVSLPKLKEYAEYARTEKMEMLSEIVHKKIEEVIMNYLLRLKQDDFSGESVYDDLVNALTTSDYSFKVQKWCVLNIPLCKMKRELIDDGYLPILNGKTITVKKCTVVKSKRPSSDKSDTISKISQKICGKNAEAREIHDSENCECYCSCQKCWHTICRMG